MKAIIQRVTRATVTVGEEQVSSIGRGLCVLLGMSVDDTQRDADYMVRKILNLRLFDDENEQAWSKSVMDLGLEVLCVSQFTLQCMLKGNKPDFPSAMPPELAEPFYNNILENMRSTYKPECIKDGRFGAYMQVHIQNDGPVTVELTSPAGPADAKQHPTHFLADEESFFPAAEQFKCPCCPFRTTQHHTIVFHLRNHLNGAVHHGEYRICKCSLGCRDSSHFHCLSCVKTIIRRNQFIYHIKTCSKISTSVPKSPVIAPVAQSPVTGPIAQSPVTACVAQSPVTAPVAQSPVTAPVAQSPVTAPVAQSPGTALVAQSPVTACVAQSPVMAPVAQSPVTACVAQSPVTAPVAQSPVTACVAQSPVMAPVAQSPVTAPVAQSPVTAPVAQSPVTACVAQSPVTAPIAQSPVTACVAQSPVTAPVAQSPGTAVVAQSLIITAPIPQSPVAAHVATQQAFQPQIHHSTHFLADMELFFPAAGQFKCPCCPFRTAQHHTILFHLRNHLNGAVHHGEYRICKCSLGCRDSSHFHCLSCVKTIIRRNQFISHIKTCSKISPSVPKGHVTAPVAQSPVTAPVAQSLVTAPVAQSRVTAPIAQSPGTVLVAQSPGTAPVAQSPGTAPVAQSPGTALVAQSPGTAPVAQSPRTALVAQSPVAAPIVKQQASQPQIRLSGQQQQKIQCVHCGLTLNRRNLRLHCKRKHIETTVLSN